jgi:proton-coupled amino acid transporter
MDKAHRNYKWKMYAERSAVVVAGVTLAILFAHNLDKFISLFGAIIGVTVILIIPAFCHFKLLAKTPFELGADITIMIFGVLMLVIAPVTIVISWSSVKDK